MACSDCHRYYRFSNPKKKILKKAGVVSFTKDSSGDLWIGIHGAIMKYNRKSKSITSVNLPYTDFVTEPFPVYADRNDNIWMGYNKYLVRYHPASGRFTKFDYPVKSASYDYDFLQCIYEDNGILWLGSTNGLFAFDMFKEKIERHYLHEKDNSNSLSNNFIFSLQRDLNQPEKYLWIGTKGGGLNRLNKMNGSYTRYNMKNGLSNNVVYGILPDSIGNIWLSTNKGLSSLNLTTEEFRNFDVNDGLQSNEYNRYAYCKTKEGLLVFGGMNGLNYFNPTEVGALSPPDVVFTDFRLFNKLINLREKGSPLTTDIAYTSKMVFRYEQNVITFQFAATDYRKQGSIQYRYRMEGFDKDWVYSGNIHEATYTNLNPGNYTFLVQARFKNGSWGTKRASLYIIVKPPWWLTWWFFLIVFIIAFAVLYGVHRYRVYQLTRLERLRNRIARDLHDEVGSSISTIAIYSKIAHEQIGSETFNNEPLLKKITDYATDIMESMNDIVWNINTQNDAFEHIISRMCEHASQLLEAKGYTLHLSFDETLNQTKLTMEKRRDFYLIYKEALNNIAKYANGKNVWITLKKDHHVLSFTIKDDGRGFDSGTLRKGGNGLTNMHFRAKALEGEIQIHSKPGEGTIISLSFTGNK